MNETEMEELLFTMQNAMSLGSEDIYMIVTTLRKANFFNSFGKRFYLLILEHKLNIDRERILNHKVLEYADENQEKTPD